jgi:hypothetical protein
MHEFPGTSCNEMQPVSKVSSREGVRCRGCGDVRFEAHGNRQLRYSLSRLHTHHTPTLEVFQLIHQISPRFTSHTRFLGPYCATVRTLLMRLSTTRRCRVGSHTFHLQEHLSSTQSRAAIELLAIPAETSGYPIGCKPEGPMLSLVKEDYTVHGVPLLGPSSLFTASV